MMNTKTCAQCGKTYTPTRSDSVCCSDQCRSKFNYERKKRKNVAFKQPIIGENKEVSLVLKGELASKEIWEKVAEIEQKMEEISAKMENLNAQNISFQKEISTFKNQIQTIKEGDLQKLSSFAQMSDYYLFNNYLNEEYLEAKRRNDSFADFKVKSESDLESSLNKKYRLQIDNYRMKISAKIDLLNNQIIALELAINEKEQLIKINNELIKENQVQMRFFESRVLKYEAMFYR